jgi:hypothetical protein
MHKIQGFLYGHYDSRGGATFIEGTDKAKADAEYVLPFCLEQVFPDEPEVVKERNREIIEQDFLGEATIESEFRIENEQDIEQGEHAEPLWVRFVPNDPKNEGFQGSPGRYELAIGTKPPAEDWKESELGEDAFGVIVLRS